MREVDPLPNTASILLDRALDAHLGFVLVLQHKIVLINNLNEKVAELLKVAVEERLLSRFFCIRSTLGFSARLTGSLAIVYVHRTGCSFLLKIFDAGLELLLESHFLLIFTVDNGPDGVPTDDLRAVMIECDVSNLLHALPLNVLQLLVAVEIHGVVSQAHC